MNAAELKSVIDNPSTAPEDRASALAALQDMERNGEDRLARRDAKRALDAINASEVEEHDFSQKNIFRLLRDDGVIDMSPEYLRAYYLADPKVSIHWAYLKFFADRLRSTSSTLRAFAESRIKMLADDPEIPADVRRAAADFLEALDKRGAGDALPQINIPGNERWRTMPNAELHQRTVLHKKSWTDAFYTQR